MRERLQHLDGRLELDSSKSGTTVRAILPLNRSNE
jgi:signal transduction histidine kinase